MSLTPEGRYVDDKIGEVRDLTYEEKCIIGDEKYDMWREEQDEQN